MKKLLICAAVFSIVFVSLATAADDVKVPLRFNRWYNYDELTAAMRQLHQAFPNLTRLESIGKSYQGRDMWLLTIANPKTGAEKGKPAMWVDGNIHGNEIQASEVCLYLSWYLLENYGKIDRVTAIVDRAVFHILPSVNPDGRAWFFDQPNTASSSRSGQKPVDDDLDGFFDEDPPDDLDGNGSITMMRKRDPNGDMKTDPEDPRLMIPVKPGEKGEWILLGQEGIDNDGDGRINEDGPGGYDLNRNWGYGWMPNYVQNGAGDFPFSHAEPRNIRDFMVKHPNIIGAQSFHNSGGMILRGPGASSELPFNLSDIRVYDSIGKRGEEMLPFYRYMIIWKDLYTVYGGSINWMYGCLGAFAFTNELDYDELEDTDRDGKVDDRERLKFDDYLRLGVGYQEWQPAKHPLYGDIEIGGWTKYTGRTYATFQREEMLHRNALFALYHAESMPLLAFQDTKVEKLGGGLFRVNVIVENRAAIPTRSAFAVQHKIGRADLARVTGASVTVLQAGTVDDPFLGTASYQEKDPARLWIDAAPGYGILRLQWLVSGSGQVTISYDSEKGGRIEKVLELK